MMYIKGRGYLIVLSGVTILIPETMNIKALANHVRELRDYYA